MFFLFILTSFYQEAGKIYGEEHDFGRFKEAYLTIKKNLNPEEKVIFGQYLRTYYLKEIGEDNLVVIDMLNNGQYSYESFLKDISKYDSGWITWETRKGYHIRGDIKNYINKNFKKYHGRGIDDTNVEVYYFDRSMLK